jgi:hypothetical protein
MFANMFFTLEIVRSGDRDLAARKAAAGAAIDALVEGVANTAEAAEARTRSSRGGPNQALPPEATVVGVGELPGLPEPVHPRQETVREDRTAQRQRDLRQQYEHAARLGATRRR